MPRWTGYSTRKNRFHKDFCERCTYLFSLELCIDDGTFVPVDVYRSCEDGNLIINLSDEGGDYISAVTLESLVARYVVVGKGYR